MNIIVFSPDMPYPPNRGGRADIWRRMQAMVRLGHSLMLVHLDDPLASSAASALEKRYVDTVVTKRFSFPIKRSILRTIQQLALSWMVPWHAATRIPSRAEKDELFEVAAQFDADLIWLDGPWFGVIGYELSKRLSVPTVYRSHNIEHKYLWGQAMAAVRLRDKLAWSLVCIGLGRFEKATMLSASAVFDISIDDLNDWKSAGVTNIHWLPPLPQLALDLPVIPPIPGDIVFVGNLGTPNNVRGVEWLVTEVLPRVRARLPDARCRIVGSHPTPHISTLLSAASDVEVCANVPDPTPYLFGAKVLVNPVMTGSGVQVKILDMLMTDAPIVTASQGTRGLPGHFKSLFRVADDADSFAKAICEELQESSADIVSRATAREAFSVAAVGRALEIAQTTLPNHARA